MLMNIHLRKEEASYTYSDRGTGATPTYSHKKPETAGMPE
jgi:hypothetical protein